MNRDRKYFAIGLFVILGFLLFAAGCLLFGGSDLLTDKVYFETYFASSVQGMDVGSAVKLRGVRVGSVEEIGFARSHYQDRLPEDSPAEDQRTLSYVRVLCSLDADRHGELREDALRTLIGRGLIAKQGSQGITGIVFVDLDFLRPDDRAKTEFLRVPWTPDEVYIPSVPNTLQSIVTVAERVADNIGKIDFGAMAASMTRLTDTVDTAIGKADIPALAKRLSTLADSADTLVTRLSDTLGNVDGPALAADLSAAVANLRATSETLREKLPAIGEKAQPLLDDAHDAVISLGDLSGELADLTRSLRSDVRFGDLGDTLESLNRASAQLEALLTSLRDRPSRLIFDDEPAE